MYHVPCAFSIIDVFSPRSSAENRGETPLSLRQGKRGKIDAMSILLVLTNLPDAESAQALATHLVEQSLAACVSILPPCRSVYRWQGKMEEANEVPVLIKTTEERYPELEAAIRARHPYELPEIVAVSVERGLPEYLAWVAESTSLAVSFPSSGFP
jgi:periplasmic divalent cation tolerance protein